jgi:hypothetical protein
MMNIGGLSHTYDGFPHQGFFSEQQDREVFCDFSGSWMPELSSWNKQAEL